MKIENGKESDLSVPFIVNALLTLLVVSRDVGFDELASIINQIKLDKAIKTTIYDFAVTFNSLPLCCAKCN